MKFFALLAFVGLAAASRLHHPSHSGSYSSEYESGVGSAPSGLGLGGLGLSGSGLGLTHPLKYQPGQELVYTYNGRLLTGIPELNQHHYSGLAIKAEVVVQVKESGRLVLQVRNPEYAHANHQLTPESGDQEGNNWRHLQMPSYKPVPEASRKMLEIPTFFEIEGLRIKTLSVSGEEPEWSVNFKKALVALFQTGSIQNESSSVRSSLENGIPKVWTSFEQSPDGDCETKYTMHEIPESMPRGSESEKHGDVSLPQACPKPLEGERSKLFEIIKVRNLDNCLKTSVFAYSKPGMWNCEKSGRKFNGPLSNWNEKMSSGSCGSTWTRSSVTRYTVCGTPERYVIQSIVNEGELYTQPMTIKTEKMLTGTRQVLKLVRKNSIESHISEESVPGVKSVHNSLLFKYSKKQEEEHIEKLSGSGLIPHGSESVSEQISKEEMIRKAEELIKEVIHTDIFNVHGLPNEHLSYKVLILSKVFKLFDRTMLMKVYENVVRSESGEKHTVAKNVLVDTVVMSGTPESIKFFLHLVERNELPKTQIAAIFFHLPRNVIIPTQTLLEEIFEVVKSEPIRRNEPYVYRTALLSFSNLVQKACLSHEKDIAYPTGLLGRFCHKESSIVTEKWIPYLERELRTEVSRSSPEHRYVVITALSLLSHEQVLPILLPIIEEEGMGEFSRETVHMARYIAIYGLTKTGRHYPERVLPVVSAIYTNKGEPTDIRIAAFHVLINLRPDMTLLQKIATLTWYEKDTEVLRTVNTAFYTLAHETSMQDYQPEMSALIRRVRLIYPLIKKTGGRFPTSATVFTNDFMNKMKAGYQGVTSYIGAENSVVPSMIYDRLTIFESEEYMYTPYEIAVHMREIFPNLYDALSGTSSTPFEELKSKVGQEWRQTIEKLRLKIRENGTPEAFVYMTLMEDSSIFVSLAKSSGHELKQVLKNPALLKEYLSGERKFNYQRVFDLSPAEAMIPSDLGLPIYGLLNAPTVLSFRGFIGSESDVTRGKLDMTFEAVIDKRIIGTMGTICPFTGEYIISGVDQHKTLALPVDWTLRFDLPEGKIESDIKLASSRVAPSGPYDLMYYSVTPFTAIQKVFNLKPVFKTGNYKVIKSLTPLKEEEMSVGEYLGLSLKLKYKSETPYFGMRYYIEKMSNLKYNPINYFRFQNLITLGLTPTGLPSARKHEMRMVFDPQSSATKEMSFSLRFGYATKEKEEPTKYHKIVTESNKVVKVVSEPIGRISSQVKRQEILKNIIERLRIQSEGKAFTVLMTATVRGGRPQTFTYSATVASGMEGIKQKWELKLKSESSRRAICIVGDVDLPPISKLDIEQIRSERPVFHFHNVFAYGVECETKIILNGVAQTSEKQKQLSKETPEAKEYYRLLRKGTPMIKMSKLAEKVRLQASAIDEIKTTVQFVNAGPVTKRVTRQSLEALQIYWLPYYRYSSESEYYPRSSSYSSLPVESMEEELEMISGPVSPVKYGRSYLSPESEESSFTLEVRSRIHPQRKTIDFDIVASEPEQVKYVYRDVPLPYPATYMYPISYVHGPASSAIKYVIGKPVYPVCTLEGRHITTFDNRTYMANMDECFHLLSGDCSKAVEYGVLVRALSRSEPQKKVLKVVIKRAEIELKPEGRSVRVYINGKPVHISETEYINVEEAGKVIAKIIKYKDQTIKVTSSKINVEFNGEEAKLEGSYLLKNKLCGLCGDNNNKKSDDLMSPRKCILSRPELVVASYRVGSLPSKQCSVPLPESLRQELEKEESRCVKPESKWTRVSESYLRSYSQYFYGGSSGSQCQRMHHEIVDKHASNEYCFSRIPILECGYKCHPVGVREKTVSFTCMQKNRSSEYLAEKVRNGEIVPELKKYPETYSTVRTLPVDCKPYSIYSGSEESSYESTTPYYPRGSY